ncbi:hypothetical protein [Bradyrhizobium sp. USDA 3650]
MDQQQVTDSVSIFLYAAREQELKSISAYPELVEALDRLNAVVDGIPSVPIAGPALPPLLLSQAHSSFLAAVRMSLAGQVHVAYGALRSSIECALYALMMRHQPWTQEVWINRQSNRRACRDTFTFGAGLAILKKMDAPLAQLIQELYDAAIDNGAHPNILSLGRHLDFSDWDEANGLRNILLLPEDDQSVDGVLHSCLLVGAAVASIYPYVMPEHGPAIAAPQDAKLTLQSVIASVTD